MAFIELTPRELVSYYRLSREAIKSVKEDNLAMLLVFGIPSDLARSIAIHLEECPICSEQLQGEFRRLTGLTQEIEDHESPDFDAETIAEADRIVKEFERDKKLRQMVGEAHPFNLMETAERVIALMAGSLEGAHAFYKHLQTCLPHDE